MESLLFLLETATAQESFHRHRLRPALNLKVPVAQLLDELNDFSKSRAIETANHDGDYVDAPMGTWSSTYRADAEKYMQGGHFVSDPDSDGNLYLAMREDPQSLGLTKQLGCMCQCLYFFSCNTFSCLGLSHYINRGKNPEAIMSRCRTPLTATVLKQLKRIIALRDTEELPEEVLRALGCRLERSVEALESNVATLRRWCICIIGPGAQKHWQQQPAEGAAPDVADHTCGRCYLCLEHATYGGCSHVYVGFRIKGVLQDLLAETYITSLLRLSNCIMAYVSLWAPLVRMILEILHTTAFSCSLQEEQPWPDPKRRPKRKRDGVILTPTKPRSESAPPTPSCRSQSATTELSLRLKQLLRKHNMAVYEKMMVQYALTEDELQKWDLPSLMMLLRSPAAATRLFLEDLHRQACDSRHKEMY